MLYLVHRPLLYTLDAYPAPLIIIFTGGETDMKWSSVLVLVYLKFWPMVMWYVDLVCRLVDENISEKCTMTRIAERYR